MKKFLFLTIILLATTSSSFAQYGHFVELTDGTIIEGKVEYQSKMFKSPRIIVNDTTSFSLNKVKAYQNSLGYFLRMTKGTGDRFVKRIGRGNIDLYSRTITIQNPDYKPRPDGMPYFVRRSRSSAEVKYFTKDDGPLLKVNAKNLKEALSDNDLSMSYLKKRDRLTVVQVIGAVAGFGFSVYSLASQSDREEVNPTGAILGLGLAGGSLWIPSFYKENLTHKAIRVYNNPHRY